MRNRHRSMSIQNRSLSRKFLISLALMGFIPLLMSAYIVTNSLRSDPMSWKTAVLILSVTFFAGLMGFGLSRGALAELRRVVRYALALVPEVRSRQPVDSADELDILAQSFTHINDKLQHTIDALEESKRRLQASFYQIGVALGSSLDSKGLSQLIVDISTQLVDARRGSILLATEDRDELFLSAACGLTAKQGNDVRVKFGEGVAGWVAQRAEPILVADIEKDPRFNRKARKGHTGPSFISVPITLQESVLAVPLMVSDHVIGVLNVSSKTDGSAFEEEDLQVLVSLAQQAAVAIENARLHGRLNTGYYETVHALASAVEAKDPYTKGHSDRVTTYAVATAKRMGLSAEEIATLRYAGALHDIGKIGMSELILNKPGKLSEQEWEIVRLHPEIGASIIRDVEFLKETVPIIRHHHERYDGKGYPDGLGNSSLTMLTHIVIAADAFDAMTSKRSYRPALTTAQAFKELRRCSGTQFDPTVANAMIRTISAMGVPPVAVRDASPLAVPKILALQSAPASAPA